MTYAEAMARLLALRGGEHAGMEPGLARIEGLLAALGHPENRYTLVQVGGTNGKGSVAAMIAAMLKATGRRVGLYTSPHLVSFRERIRVDAEAISEDDLVDGVEALGTLIARFDATVFEATTALALDHFSRESVDVVVLEVGLGGRLDATTVGTPTVTVLTPIALDHQAVLGTTLAAIAAEKAAIVRSGIAIAAEQAAEARDVVVQRARAVGVPLLLAGRDLRIRTRERGPRGQRLDCEGPGWALADLRLALPGAFQADNALLAVAAARVLGVGEPAIRAGLAGVRWPGRFQIIGAAPRLVLDGAHNPAGAQALAAALREAFPGEAVTLIAGVMRDKDAAGILAPLSALAARVILTAARTPRAAAPEMLRGMLPAERRASAATAPSVVEALAMAGRAPHTPIVCVAGARSLVGDMLAHLFGPDKPCSIENGADSMDSLFS